MPFWQLDQQVALPLHHSIIIKTNSWGSQCLLLIFWPSPGGIFAPLRALYMADIKTEMIGCWCQQLIPHLGQRPNQRCFSRQLTLQLGQHWWCCNSWHNSLDDARAHLSLLGIYSSVHTSWLTSKLADIATNHQKYLNEVDTSILMSHYWIFIMPCLLAPDRSWK